MEEEWDFKEMLKGFIVGFLTFFVIGMVLGTINNQIMYCESNIDKYNGKYIYVYKGFIEETNNEQYLLGKAPYIDCKYNIKKWFDTPVKEKVNDTINMYKSILNIND